MGLLDHGMAHEFERGVRRCVRAHRERVKAQRLLFRMLVLLLLAPGASAGAMRETRRSEASNPAALHPGTNLRHVALDVSSRSAQGAFAPAFCYAPCMRKEPLDGVGLACDPNVLLYSTHPSGPSQAGHVDFGPDYNVNVPLSDCDTTTISASAPVGNVRPRVPSTITDPAMLSILNVAGCGELLAQTQGREYHLGRPGSAGANYTELLSPNCGCVLARARGLRRPGGNNSSPVLRSSLRASRLIFR